eukprot:scaffold4016_cov116-Skeletonema_menzelii.AAC.1
MSDEEWYEESLLQWSMHAIESIGGSPHYHACLIDYLVAKLAEEAGSNEAKEEDVAAATTHSMEGISIGTLVLCGASGKHNKYKATLANNYRMGVDKYPTSGAKACKHANS